MAGRGSPATALLTRQHVAHTVHTYSHDPRRGAYGLEASDALGVPPERVSVKAKSGEGMGEVGRGEAVRAQAVALLIRR